MLHVVLEGRILRLGVLCVFFVPKGNSSFVAVDHVPQEQATQDVDEMITEKRISMGKFINAEPPTDPDAALLRVAAACLVFSAIEEHFEYVLHTQTH